jgi:DNA invertase Pin-like site-specific DNA recombinase
MKAIAYIRVSTEEQAREGVSIEAQQEKLRQYAALRDLELVEVIVDAGESAKNLERPGMKRLRALLEQEEDVEHLLVYALDRLTRRLRDLLLLVDDEIEGNGVKLHSIQEQVDTSSPAGRAMLQIIGVFAEMERGLISERTKAALAYKREKGERLGTTPLGFITPEPGADMEPDERGLEAVRLILAQREAGATYRAIVEQLEAADLPTKRGKRWAPMTVRNVWLARDRYAEVLSAAA